MIYFAKVLGLRRETIEVRNLLRRMSVTLCFAVPTAALALPSDLDPAFGETGIATIPGASRMYDAALFPDGGMAVAVEQLPNHRVLRLDAAGRLDPSFSSVSNMTFADIRSVAIMPDGRFVVLHHSEGVPICRSWLSRHFPSGVADTTFGSGGVWQIGGSRCSIHGNLAVDSRGESHFSTSSASLPLFTAFVRRVDPTGVRWDALGSAQGHGTAPWYYGRIALQADGIPVSAVQFRPHISVARFLGTTLDPGFGDAGIASAAATPVQGEAHDVGIARDGGIVVAGPADRLSGRQIVVARFNSLGQVDTTFGDGGVVLVEAAKAGETVQGVFLEIQPDGKIVLASTVYKPFRSGEQFPRIVLARLTESGALDLTFARGGITDLWSKRGTQLSALLVRPDGRVVVAATVWTAYAQGVVTSEATIFQLKGGDDATIEPLRERKAVEYFHAGYGHYFLSADPEEIAVLDASPSGWARTGRTINVWDGDDPALTAVCRFWSNQTWAPKSSHFYTPYAAECAGLKSDPAWYFERNAFKVRMPDGPLGARTCRADSLPLYRAFNNGLTGAPNHRYMTDPVLLDEMIAQGWTMEGEATTRVFACLPTQ